MLSKKGTSFPKKGTSFPNRSGDGKEGVSYPSMVSAALRKDLGQTHRAAKTVMRWTGASERTVKNWFAGIKGPTGEHLITLVRHSDSVLTGLLQASGRERTISEQKLIELRRKVRDVTSLLEDVAHESR